VEQLQDFRTNRDCRPSGTRSAREELEDWIEEQRDDFCNSYAAFYASDPGGGETCQERVVGQSLAREWCGKEDRILLDGSNGTEDLCSEQYVGDGYEDLAMNFCNNPEYYEHEFCRCSNVMKHDNPQYNDNNNNKFCDTFPNASGCSTMKSVMNPILEATPLEYRYLLEDKGHCKGLICSQSADQKIFLPDGYGSGCDNNIDICNNNFNIGTTTSSQISSACNFGNGDDSVPFQSGSGSDPSSSPSSSSSSSSDPSSSPSSSPISNFFSESNLFLGSSAIGIASIIFFLIVVVLVAKNQRP
jgi:hypothetical protein